GDDGSGGKPVPTGAWMSGLYSSGAGSPAPGGLRVEFELVNAVIDCGEAHVRKPYSLQNAGGSVSISVANDKSPFSLVLRPDGSLSGSGTVEVNGRLLSGKDGRGEFTFKPVTARCALGTLASK